MTDIPRAIPQETLDQCKIAFPGIADGNHVLRPGDLDGLNTPEEKAAQQALGQHYGFPHPDDVLQLSHIAGNCTKDLQADDFRRGVEEYTRQKIDTAKDEVLKANLEHKKYAVIEHIGVGEIHTDKNFNTYWTPPPLNQQQKDIIAGINKIPGIHAQVKEFKEGEGAGYNVTEGGVFYIVASDNLSPPAKTPPAKPPGKHHK